MLSKIRLNLWHIFPNVWPIFDQGQTKIWPHYILLSLSNSTVFLRDLHPHKELPLTITLATDELPQERVTHKRIFIRGSSKHLASKLSTHPPSHFLTLVRIYVSDFGTNPPVPMCLLIIRRIMHVCTLLCTHTNMYTNMVWILCLYFTSQIYDVRTP